MFLYIHTVYVKNPTCENLPMAENTGKNVEFPELQYRAQFPIHFPEPFQNLSCKTSGHVHDNVQEIAPCAVSRKYGISQEM